MATRWLSPLLTLALAACTQVTEREVAPGDPDGLGALKGDSAGPGWLDWDGQAPDANAELSTPNWPDLQEEPAPPCQAAQTNSWYFQFLDNLCNERVNPSDQDRDRPCPADNSSPEMLRADGSSATYQPGWEIPAWNTTDLAGIVPEELEVAVILIRRVGGVPHYRYLSNGRHDVPFQPWSTTKVLAAANGAAYLRMESNGLVGLDSTVAGFKVGDLVTSLVTYDDDPFNSNSLGAWFHDVGGRQRARDLIGHLWLNRPPEESFGGNYGSLPPDIGYHFMGSDGAELQVVPDLSSGYSNRLSAATLAEALKRIVLHREEPEQRLPGLAWEDVKVLLYGAEDSMKGLWGGMTADTAIYLQAGHDMNYIEERSAGQWLTLSKLGMGTKGQFAHMGYACFPVIGDDGAPVIDQGREFVIATHLTEGDGGWATRDRELARIIRRLEIRIVDGRL